MKFHTPPMPGRALLILACIVLLLCSSCRKGVDDPLLSLRTRKARVEGSWRFSEGSLVIRTTDKKDSTEYSEEYTFSGNKYDVKVSGTNMAPSTSSGVYILNLHCDKERHFILNEQLDGRKLSSEGNWDFNMGVSYERKKEVLLMYIREVSSSKTGGYHFFNQGSMDFSYKIKELRHKKMVLTADVPVYIDADEATQTFKGEFTFTQ